MKRILNGVTYNTDTASRLGEVKDTVGDDVGELYQNAGGAFFVFTSSRINRWNERTRTGKDEFQEAINPVSPQAAKDWLALPSVTVLNNPFEKADEKATDSASSTVYVRVPATLKRAIEQAAEEAGMSGNLWTMRCLERGVHDADLKALLGNMAATLQYLKDEDHRLDSGERLRVGKAMMHLVESAWKRRFPSIPAEEIGRNADDQFDEYLEAAVQDSFAD